MRVSDSTVRRWAALLRGGTSFTSAECRTIAEGWALDNGVGGQHLLEVVQNFEELSAPEEVVTWMAVGLDHSVAKFYGAYGITPQQCRWLFEVDTNEASEAAMSERTLDDLDAGVPVGLYLLLHWAGCTTNAEFDGHLTRWRDGEEIESGLRLLAALLTPDRPIPHPTAPPLYPAPNARRP